LNQLCLVTDAENTIGPATARTLPRSAPGLLQILPRLGAGGVERGTVDVASAAARAGWRSHVASAGGRLVQELERAGARHVALPVDSKNPLVIHANIRRLEALIEGEGIDLIHARSRAPAWSAYAAARRTGIPFVTTFHNAYGAENWFKRRYNGVMARGERIIAISSFVAEHAIAVYGIPRKNIRVIERGIDIDRFHPDRVDAQSIIRLAENWDLDDGSPTIMLPGRLTRWKGQLVLLEALERLGRADLRCLFVGGGDNHYRGILEGRIARSPLVGRCRIVEDCADMPAAYSLADVVVSASTRPEGFGRVIAEGLAMGRPVIATDHGGAREIVTPGETGWLVPPGDPEALASALGEALALDGTGRAAMAERGIARVRERFTRERMTDLTLQVYDELRSARRGARSLA
jgi:glycosyltransferase involved in cell wall biosynthesis